jgi:hypothetical protein
MTVLPLLPVHLALKFHRLLAATLNAQNILQEFQILRLA